MTPLEFWTRWVAFAAVATFLLCLVDPRGDLP